MSKEYIVKLIENTFSGTIGDVFKANNVMIAGGLLTSAFTGKEVNDVDCYFRSKSDLTNLIKDLVDESSGSSFVTSVTDKSMTLSVGGLPTVQLIYFDYHEDLHNVFENFDFTINMAGYDFKTGELVTHEDFFSDISQRQLRFNKNTAFPLISCIREGKYVSRGYKMSRSEKLKMLLEVSKLNLNSKEEFVKHVGGMYGATVLKYIHSNEKFDIDKALEIVSEKLSSNKTLWDLGKEFVKGKPDVISSSLGDLVWVLELEDCPEYSVMGNDVYLEDEDSEVNEIQYNQADLLRIFFPEKEVKRQFIESGYYYKWVKGDPEGSEFTSLYEDTFKYNLNEEAKDEDNGLYLLTDEGLKNHYFRDKGKACILMCKVDSSDFFKFDGHRNTEGDKFAVTKLTPIKAFKKEQVEMLLPSNKVLVNVGGKDNKLSLPIAPSIPF